MHPLLYAPLARGSFRGQTVSKLNRTPGVSRRVQAEVLDFEERCTRAWAEEECSLLMASHDSPCPEMDLRGMFSDAGGPGVLQNSSHSWKHWWRGVHPGLRNEQPSCASCHADRVEGKRAKFLYIIPPMNWSKAAELTPLSSPIAARMLDKIHPCRTRGPHFPRYTPASLQ